MNRKQYKKDRKFKNDRMCSLDDVAKELGVSIERARVVEQNALRKCRKWCDDNDFDLEQLMSVFSREENRTYRLDLESAQEEEC
jgi:hypothetical protein